MWCGSNCFDVVKFWPTWTTLWLQDIIFIQLFASWKHFRKRETNPKERKKGYVFVKHCAPGGNNQKLLGQGHKVKNFGTNQYKWDSWLFFCIILKERFCLKECTYVWCSDRAMCKSGSAFLKNALDHALTPNTPSRYFRQSSFSYKYS